MRTYSKMLAGLAAYGALAASLLLTATPALAAPEKPVIVSEAAAAITPTDAMLEGSVSPEAQETIYHLEYATDEAFTSGITTLAYGIVPPGIATPQTVGPVDLGNGLTPDTTYYYRVVAKNATGETTGATEHFTTLALEKPVVDSEAFAGNIASGVTLEAQINANYQATSYTFEYSTEGSTATNTLAGAITTTPGTTPLAAVGGEQTASVLAEALQAGVTYYYRVIAVNATGATAGPVQAKTLTPAPTVTTGAASSITSTTAVIGGEVDPEGLETHYYVQYGSDGEYNYSAPSAPGLNAGSAEGTVTLGAAGVPLVTLTELAPGTTYDYRLVAVNGDGITYGSPQSFTTAPPLLPVAVTGGASGVSEFSATITGSVDTENLQIMVGFEFGSTPALGSVEPAQIGSTSLTTEAIEASFIASLEPGTTYYYRTVATGPQGASYGAVQSFTTASFPEPQSGPGALPLSSPTSQPSTAAPSTTKTTKTAAKKKLTNAQKLAKALRGCRKKPKGAKRTGCERRARKRR
jgi:hypothetical protein